VTLTRDKATMDAIRDCPNLATLFLDRADALSDVPFLWHKADAGWQSLSWAEARRQATALSERLVALGLSPGDKVVLLSENRPEWAIADLGITMAGCVTVPAYTTNTERDHQHILDNSCAKAIVVSTAKLARAAMPAVLRADIDHLIAMEPLRTGQTGAVAVHDWADLTSGPDASDAVRRRVAGIGRSDTACIIYTSGTGGSPRGVEQHHGMILHNAHAAGTIVLEDFGWDEEVFLSFLPLSHAYEHTAGQWLPIGLGAQIYYSQGLDKLAGDIEAVSPTIMAVVPRLFELLRSRLLKQLQTGGRLANTLMNKALTLAQRRAEGRGRAIDWPLQFLVDRTVKRKARASFGGRIKAMISGGAPLNPEVGLFFQSLGVPLLQGYGQTEAGPIISCNRPAAGVEMATVGPPLPNVDVRIAEDGEILVAGELVMHGYWRNQAETDRVLIDGWLHTGDIGHLDDAGRLVITDRKKDLIVNDKGDNIAPQKVEGILTLQPEIAQAMIHGDQRPYVVALLVPDAEWAADWARANGRDFDLEALRQDAGFSTALRAAVDRVNKELSVTERVRRHVLADEPFAIEQGEMTPSMKIRRHVIRARYEDRLDALYKS